MPLYTKNRLFIFFLFIFASCLIYISGWFALLRFIFSLLGYWIVFYLLYCLWKKIRKKHIGTYKEFSELFIQKIVSLLCLLILILGAFCSYQNIFRPAKLPLYTLTNGEQSIIFQTMSHIASSEFYEGVKNDIIKAKKDDFVLYFEGVQPGSTENMEKFNTALGVKFDAGVYDNLSKLYGIVAQDNELFLGLENNKDYNVDLSIDDIMELYTPSTEKKGLPKEAYDINNDIVSRLSELSAKELAILRFINQSFLNFIMKNEVFRDTIIQNLGNTDLFEVILEDRNKHIVEEVYNRKDEKIFILYGLMHFKGVLDILQQRDPNWRIENIEYKQVIYSL